MRSLLIAAAVGCRLAGANDIPASSLATNVNLNPLPYDYNSLEPFISEATMRVHHLGHHQAYTDKTNAALHELRLTNRTRVLADKGLPWLLKHLDIVDEPVRTALRNSGGGFWNHDFFFSSLAPSSNSTVHPDAPGGKFNESSAIGQRIIQDFGSFSGMKSLFEATANDFFGSGWAWLSLGALPGDDNPSLMISSTSNQENPLMMYGGSVPLLGLDLWEHAYYLDHQNKRLKYIQSYWNVVNWDVVNARYEAALSKWGVVDPADEVPPGFLTDEMQAQNDIFGGFFKQFGGGSSSESAESASVDAATGAVSAGSGNAGAAAAASDDESLKDLMAQFDQMRQEAEAEAARASEEAQKQAAAAAAEGSTPAASSGEAAPRAAAEVPAPAAPANVEPAAEPAAPVQQQQQEQPAQQQQPAKVPVPPSQPTAAPAAEQPPQPPKERRSKGTGKKGKRGQKQE